jgi:hypothetical protein
MTRFRVLPRSVMIFSRSPGKLRACGGRKRVMLTEYREGAGYRLRSPFDGGQARLSREVQDAAGRRARSLAPEVVAWLEVHIMALRREVVRLGGDQYAGWTVADGAVARGDSVLWEGMESFMASTRAALKRAVEVRRELALVKQVIEEAVVEMASSEMWTVRNPPVEELLPFVQRLCAAKSDGEIRERALEARVRALEARVRELEARLGEMGDRS